MKLLLPNQTIDDIAKKVDAIARKGEMTPSRPLNIEGKK
jgi:hypothetical protein